jgi:hypothetical protein
MARRGSFSKGYVEYGAPLSFVHPQDNVMPKPFVDELYDPSLGLTDEQREELQDRIDDLYGTLRGERDYLKP